MDKQIFGTKHEALADLKHNYHNLGYPIAFSGISKIKKKRRIEPLSSIKNSAILRKLSARAVQNRNLGY